MREPYTVSTPLCSACMVVYVLHNQINLQVTSSDYMARFTCPYNVKSTPSGKWMLTPQVQGTTEYDAFDKG